MDSQIDALQKYAEEHEYSVVGVYNDAGISARKKYKKRPALLQLMQDCEDKKVDLVCFTKLDRWFRSVADYYEVQSILDKNKVAWRAIWEDYETETSSGIFKVNIMLSIAQAEADRTSERIKSVNEYRRANGAITYGRAPTGYKSVKGQIVIDESKREAVKAGFRAYLDSTNVTDFQNAMKAHGIVVARETVSRMIKNPTYSGDAYGVQCEPYVTKEEWDYIQYIVESRKVRKTRRPNRTYIFGGVIRCASCGYQYHSQLRTCYEYPYAEDKGKKYNYKYYVCGRARNGLCDNNSSITEKAVEKKLLQSLKPAYDEYVISGAIDMSGGRDYEKERKAIESRIQRIGDRYELDEISREEYIQKVKQLKAQLSELHPPVSKPMAPLPDNWLDMYNALDEEHKKNFWSTTVKYIQINKNRDVKPVF